MKNSYPFSLVLVAVGLPLGVVAESCETREVGLLFEDAELEDTSLLAISARPRRMGMERRGTTELWRRVGDLLVNSSEVLVRLDVGEDSALSTAPALLSGLEEVTKFASKDLAVFVDGLDRCDADLQRSMRHRSDLQAAYDANRSGFEACVTLETHAAQVLAGCTATVGKDGGTADCQAEREALMARTAECEKARLNMNTGACHLETEARLQCEARSRCASCIFGASMALPQRGAPRADTQETEPGRTWRTAVVLRCLSSGLKRLIRSQEATTLRRCINWANKNSSEDGDEIVLSGCARDEQPQCFEEQRWVHPCQSCPTMPQSLSALEKKGGVLVGDFVCGQHVELRAMEHKSCNDQGEGAVTLPVVCTEIANFTLELETRSDAGGTSLRVAVPESSQVIPLDQDGWITTNVTVSMSLQARKHFTLKLSGNSGAVQIRDLRVLSPVCALERSLETSEEVSLLQGGEGPVLLAVSEYVRKTSTSSVLLVVLFPIGVFLLAIAACGMVLGVEGVDFGKKKTVEKVARSESQTARSTMGESKSSDRAVPFERFRQQPVQSTVVDPFTAVDATVLCPELEVPGSSECVVAMPSLAGVQRGEVLLRNVTDKTGQPLLRVGTTTQRSTSTNSEYVLLAKTNEQELTFCELCFPEPGQEGEHPIGQVFQWNGSLYAKVWEERAQVARARPMDVDLRTFLVTSATANHWQVRFQGNFVERKASVVSETGQIISMITPGDDLVFPRSDADFYKLRLGPQADAGMIIIVLLAIDRIIALSQGAERLSWRSDGALR
uniref:Uncharacterized protein n=1 Tax=Noctiluca scintillans TaxID=2966 RepID=A0A7S0ZT56_NOCSC|mmetsp:Transcript_17236/g.46656  ORF Transcript_17236/g.46656 Transcript_17236/m.46656 type:complete len:786 (+) Transcript_17236:48-2405(+)